MPAIANMTVKKYNGTDDVVWYALQGASGQDPAIWQASLGDATQFNPELRVLSRDAPKGAPARLIRVTAVYPQLYTDTTTSLTNIANRLGFAGTWTVPKGMPDASRQEGVYQISNLIAHALMKGQALSGFAAT